MQKKNILKESCPKNVVLLKTKNDTFFYFIRKNAIFCPFMFGDL